jgi:hypothetical protein
MNWFCANKLLLSLNFGSAIAFIVLKDGQFIRVQIGLVRSYSKQRRQIETRAPATRATRVEVGLKLGVRQSPCARVENIAAFVDAYLAILRAHNKLKTEILRSELEVSDRRVSICELRSLDPTALRVFPRVETCLFIDPDETVTSHRNQTPELWMSPRNFVQTWIYLSSKNQLNTFVVIHTNGFFYLFFSMT